MKKLLLATAVMFCVGVGVVRADRRLIPTAESPNALATADYGGVDYSTYTINFLVSGTGIHYGTATASNYNGVPANANLSNSIQGVFYGIQYGSGTTADFTDVYDSTSSDMGKNTAPMTRVFNVFASTGGIGAFASGFSGPAKPMRFNKGLIYKPSRADFTSFNLLFYVFQ